ncbi:MAG: DUF1634 domain-containing protein [Chthonomonadales bacterium]
MEKDQAMIPADQKMDEVIGHLLRAGVTLASAVVLIGGIIFLARHGMEHPHYGAFKGEPETLRTVDAILKASVTLQGRAIIQLGLLILMATPIARVAFSVVAFALQRDWLYVGVTLVVLSLLLYSLAGGP